jgi:hypothetical protein
MPTFKTTLHRYRFPSGAHPGYKAMTREIEANADGRGHWMHTMDGGPGGDFTGPAEGVTSEPVELEAKHIFGNQWNEADAEGKTGRRLFDWFELARFDGYPVKAGHWLEITPAMAEARRQTLRCGYCGAQYGPLHAAPPADGFCAACLDSEHLKPDDLYLLRVLPVAECERPRFQRPNLTEGERAALMPRYVERQTTGTDSRANAKRQKQRADVLKKYEAETTAATAERDGMLWLWDHGVSLDNVIYYSHTGKFSFGWRSPVADEVKAALLDLLCEFPFPYEIKATSGKTATVAAR